MAGTQTRGGDYDDDNVAEERREEGRTRAGRPPARGENAREPQPRAGRPTRVAGSDDDDVRDAPSERDEREGAEFRRGGRKPIGFAAIDPEYQRELASRGGRRAQEERDPEMRREIGRRGGHAAQEERAPEERSEIGRMGGRARWDGEAYGAVERGEYRRGGSHPMGFAAMKPDEQKQIASRGGRRAQEERAPEERSEIGRRGGRRAQEERDPGQRSEIGRMGARARWDDDARGEVERGEYRRGGRHPMGFAAMSPEEQREIASRGGRARGGGTRASGAASGAARVVRDDADADRDRKREPGPDDDGEDRRDDDARPREPRGRNR